jgi:alkaline phosphatase
MKRPDIIIIILCILFALPATGQNYPTDSIRLSLDNKSYAANRYTPVAFHERRKSKRPKNVIFLIGDGMGLSQITAARVANGGSLYLDQVQYTGISTTHSASNFITDSGAGGTALATGRKTYNGAIGVGIDSIPIRNIREIFADEGKATGVVVTCAVTHATPATFIAHQVNRNRHEEIAKDVVNSDIDVFMGGGIRYFASRSDSTNLLKVLQEKGYYIDTQSVVKNPEINFPAGKIPEKLAGLYAEDHLVRIDSGRGNFLPEATRRAIELLHQREEGFFLMVEGSQIDWGGHANEIGYIISETMDFDQAVGEALRFAATDGRTLVVVTADHETGGLALLSGDCNSGFVTGKFTTSDHSGCMVPVFAYGPGAELFSGIYDNTDIPKKILKAMHIHFPEK